MVLATYPIHPTATTGAADDPGIYLTEMSCAEAADERAIAGGHDPAAVTIRWIAVAEIGAARSPWTPGDPIPDGTYALVCEAGIP